MNIFSLNTLSPLKSLHSFNDVNSLIYSFIGNFTIKSTHFWKINIFGSIMNKPLIIPTGQQYLLPSGKFYIVMTDSESICAR